MTILVKPKQWMLDTLDDSDLVVSDKIIGTSRWSIQYELVFKYEDKLWITYYSRGATEYQDESPWQYDEEVTSYEAEAFLIIAYRKKSTPRIARR